MFDLRGRQATFNAASRDQWAAFAGHRQRVSALLGGGGSARTRLCILGAGNCNDIDLVALLKAHREVHLVDLDTEALARGVANQGVAKHPGLRVFAGVDLTGMLDVISGWSPTTPVPASVLGALADWPPKRIGMGLPGPFDLVASTCLLSQIIDTAFRAVGGDHPQLMDVVQAIRAGHLRLLSQLAGSEGSAVLITDVVSSETLPSLGALPDSSLAALLPRLSHSGNFIHGVSPEVLLSVFRHDPVLCTRRESVELVPPWRWTLHARLYLVWAVKFRGHAGPVR